MPLPRNPKLIPLARRLRRESTQAEKHLWYDFLAIQPVRFRRQAPIGNYIVDFLCIPARLVIEVDGGGHFEEAALIVDEKRTKYMELQGLLVVRYTNDQVMKEFAAVCEDITSHLMARLKSPHLDRFAHDASPTVEA